MGRYGKLNMQFTDNIPGLFGIDMVNYNHRMEG